MAALISTVATPTAVHIFDTKVVIVAQDGQVIEIARKLPEVLRKPEKKE